MIIEGKLTEREIIANSLNLFNPLKIPSYKELIGAKKRRGRVYSINSCFSFKKYSPKKIVNKVTAEPKNKIIIKELNKTAFNFFLSVALYSATYFEVAVDIPKSPKIIKKKITVRT